MVRRNYLFPQCVISKIQSHRQWILHFLVVEKKNGDPRGLPVLSAKNPRAEVQFRIEKVSTSFMNQRFKVRFVAIPRSDAARELQVFTTPIESKAKPKRTTKKRTLKKATPTAKHVKRRRMGGNHDDDRLDTATRALIATQEKLEKTENMLASVVFQLEQCVRRLDRLENKRGGGSNHDEGTSDSEGDLMYFSTSTSVHDSMPISTRLRSSSERILNSSTTRDLSLKRMTSMNRYTSKDWLEDFETADSEMRAQNLIPGGI